MPVSGRVARVAAAARPVGAYARRLKQVGAAAAAQLELGAFDELVASLLAEPTTDAPAIDWSELGGRPDWLADDDPLLDVLAQLEPPGARWWRNQARADQLPPAGDWLHWLIMAGRGWGKALDLGTMIPTPTGYRKLGELAVGDQVIDESGRPCRITGVYDPAPRKAYRLTFSDGTTMDACDEHQWVTWTHADRKAYLRSPYEPDTSRFPNEWPAWRLARKHRHWPEPQRDPDGPGPRIRTTQEIVDTLTYGNRGDLNHAIPTAGPLQLPGADLPIDPWLLGYWLGDGHTKSAVLTVAEPDLSETLTRLHDLGYAPKVFRRADRAPSVALYGDVARSLRDLGVLGNKHVPELYLWASVEQREALLRGLMDSDGYAETSKVEFVSTTRALADAVVQLARSLGQKPVLAEGRATLNGRDCGPKFRVTWRPTRQPFSLARKVGKVDVSGGPQGLRNHHRMIVAAEEIAPVAMRCLTVDSPHHMFLAGEAMIPTHNTWTGANTLAEWAVTAPGDYACVAPTFGDARKICVEGPSGLLVALGDDLVHYNKSEFIVHVVGGSRIMLASADVPDRLRGLNLRGAWLDEMASYRDVHEVWDKALLPALRIGRLPRTVITTTPRRGNTVLLELLDRVASGDPDIAVVRGATKDNLANLSPAFIKAIYKRYAGTQLGRQELDGELLPDVEGALLRAALLELTRIRDVAMVPELRRIVVGVDPSGSGKDSSDRCGLVVAGIGPAPIGLDMPDGMVVGEHLYFLEDASARLSPEQWATRALDLADEWGADTIYAEKNMGHDLVETMLRMTARAQRRKRMPRVVPVWAARKKQARAEPVVGVWEQFRAHVVGGMPGFEDCWTSWVPGEGGESPDPLDAGVWAACGLMPELALGSATEVRVLV